ncbi:hypothetical protein [Rhizobiales bacterium]|uniref:hypothetical protein n=1 Tax=unclassified Ensifer TaxID=2633371 RepID=UPI000DE280B3
MSPLALYDAPFYLGSDKLKDKFAIVSGGDSGIRRVLFAREGADIVILHLDEDKDAQETADAVAREGRRCLVIKGDVKDSRWLRQGR